jgi:hypothetical protein
LLTTFSLGVFLSLLLAGTLAASTERVSSEGYAILPSATASSGGDGEGGGDQGGDQNGDEGGEDDFQPDSDTDEETETTDEPETDEETQPEPTPQLDISPEPTPAPQELVEICDNGQDDDNDGQIDEADSDCATQPSPTPTPTLTPFQGIFAGPKPECYDGPPSPTMHLGIIPACNDPSIEGYPKTCENVPDRGMPSGFRTECVVDKTQCVEGFEFFATFDSRICLRSEVPLTPGQFSSPTRSPMPTPVPLGGPFPTLPTTTSPSPSPSTPGPTRTPLATPIPTDTPRGLFGSTTTTPTPSPTPSPTPLANALPGLAATNTGSCIAEQARPDYPTCPTGAESDPSFYCTSGTANGVTTTFCRPAVEAGLPPSTFTDPCSLNPNSVQCINAKTYCSQVPTPPNCPASIISKSPTPATTQTPPTNVRTCADTLNPADCEAAKTRPPSEQDCLFYDFLPKCSAPTTTPSPGPSPSPSPTPTLTPSPTPTVITNVNNNQVIVRNGGFTIQNTAGAVTATPECPPQSATVLLGPSTMENGGARIMAAFEPCVLTGGTVVLNLPDEQGIQLVASNIQGGQATQSAVLPIQRVAPITEGQTLYSITLSEQMTGIDPATGSQVTLNGNINSLFLLNLGGQEVELSGDNSIALNAILRR